jgi:hypothetical protein
VVGVSTELEPWKEPEPSALPEYLDGWEEDFLAAYTPKQLRDEAEKDPALWEQAQDEALERLRLRMRYHILHRAFTPQRRPVYQRGELVGWEEKWDNDHSRWVAERMLREEYNLPHLTEISGRDGKPISWAFPMGEQAEVEAEDGDFTES